jgi:NADPH:quinone reductase-like Zn-dependent oxidoreductase
MRTIVMKAPGDADNLVLTETPVPAISGYEVLIKTQAAGINPIDIKTRKGKGLYESLRHEKPLILGWDVSGTVVETGNKVTLFRTGDEVFGMVNFPGHGKAYAGYVAAREDHLALKPARISHPEAAAASLAALTAWQVVRHTAEINAGSRVLIHSAAGGVGHFAVQMAKHLGAWVAGTASSVNREFILSLGADKHIDHRSEKFEEVLSNMDFVLDTIGDEYTFRSFRVMKPGASIICIPSGTSPGIGERAAELGLKGAHFRVRSDGSHMTEIAGLLASGALKSIVSAIFPFSSVREAHKLIETGRTRGKIVIIPD